MSSRLFEVKKKTKMVVKCNNLKTKHQNFTRTWKFIIATHWKLYDEVNIILNFLHDTNMYFVVCNSHLK